MNPIQLEIIRNALIASAEEMSVTVWRTSRSSVVREILDYSTCVFDANGFSVAQAARMPVHLNSMASCLSDILADHIPIEQWGVGDIIITNDPYSGGQHLPDIQTFMPVFYDGRRVAIVGILVHHLDVGGGAPGSYAPAATEIFQEGFRIPPLHLARAGVRNEEVIQLFLKNSREPENVGGDFMSQLAALEIGAASVSRIAERYGADRLQLAAEQIQVQSETAMRSIISDMPDGQWEFTDWVDDDGISAQPIKIHVLLKVAGDRLSIDLSNSDRQAAGPVNCTKNMSSSGVICAIMMVLGNSVPANAGVYRALQIKSRPGTCVDAVSPAPVANRMAVGHRIVNATMGALAAALPGKVAACYYGVSYAYALELESVSATQLKSKYPEASEALDAEQEPSMTRQLYFDLECGGWGAFPGADGASGFSCGFHNIANSPIEMIESIYPVLFREYALAPDSGGNGEFRGGLGLRRSFEVRSERANFTANLDRFSFPPYGLDGGESGAPGKLWVTFADRSRQDLPSKVNKLALATGDTITLQTAGGGGYGRLSQRSPDLLASDITDGYVSSDHANTIRS
ncbi:MAG: hydantoinase B/oxoprolinase family protein [Burkholderiaceae bacterium]